MPDDDRSDRFAMKYVTLSACVGCARKHSTGPTCDAYPELIPPEILDGRVRHEEPYPGDHGLIRVPMT